MIAVTILYPAKENAHFDVTYYVETHMPASMHRLRSAMRGVTVSQGVTGIPQGSAPPYFAVCELLFDSTEAFLAAFAPHAEWLQGDIKQYTDVEPAIQISEVKIHRQFVAQL